uniref:Uncharacterized protein n=1 Tax=Glossina brevipalpis TaxID=37001 RepID=A0A1A9WR14_9MUSC
MEQKITGHIKVTQLNGNGVAAAAVIVVVMACNYQRSIGYGANTGETNSKSGINAMLSAPPYLSLHEIDYYGCLQQLQLAVQELYRSFALYVFVAAINVGLVVAALEMIMICLGAC